VAPRGAAGVVKKIDDQTWLKEWWAWTKLLLIGGASEGACVEWRGNKSRTIIGEANLFPFTAQHEKKLHIKIIKSKTT